MLQKLSNLLITFVAIIIVFHLVLPFPSVVHAGSLTGISYGESGNVVGTYVQASSSDFIIFTPATGLTGGDTVTVTFPQGTVLTSGNIAAGDFAISQGTSGLCIVGGIDTAPTSILVNSGARTITFTLSSLSLSLLVSLLPCGQGAITIKTSATLAGNEIQNPTTVTTSGTLQIDTSAGGDTGSISTVIFVHGSASKISVSSQPSSTATVNVDFSAQPEFTVTDDYGNTITNDNSSQITISAVLASDGTTPGSGTISAAANPVTASSGVALFSGVDYSEAETIKLKATSSGLTQILTNSITVSAAPTPTPTPTPTPVASANTFSQAGPKPCTAYTPAKAPDLFQIDVGSSQATLYFAPVDGVVTDYFIAYGLSAGDERYGTFTGQGVSTGVLVYTVNLLKSGTTYYFRVRSQNDCMAGSWGNEMKATTTKNGKLARYYKNFLTRATSFFPRYVTVLGAKTECEYTVKKGDSLWKISSTLFGVGQKYGDIVEWNKSSYPSIINNFSIILTGWKMKICP